MRLLTTLWALLYVTIVTCQAQDNVKFESSIGVGSFSYYSGLVDVEPGPAWKGYYLPRNDKTGFRVSSTNGVRVNKYIHVGVGVGYARYDKLNGFLASGDIRIDVTQTKVAPYVYVNPGYSHFWNQYEGGTGTVMFDVGPGLRYSISGAGTIGLSVGLLLMQQNAYVSTKLGYTF